MQNSHTWDLDCESLSLSFIAILSLFDTLYSVELNFRRWRMAIYL